MRRIFFSLLLLLGCLSAAADVVTGRFIDAQSGEVLSDVEVCILTIHESAMGFHQLRCDSLGRFACNVAGYNCRLEASCVGYHPRKVGFAAMEGTDTLDLGDIALKPSEVLLRTAVATAKARRFVMRGDTVVFNPAAFNLSEGARLDELIKQLPGVTQKDGKLYWMDKPVRILVNGEEMFADNTLLQERLPAEAVDRIKAYNKGSKQKDHTGLDDGEEDHVLDIQVKPGFLEKWYGKVEGAYQTEKGYLARLDAMYLSDANPLMAYGNFNNINRQVSNRSFGGMSMGSTSPFGKQQFGSVGYKHQWLGKDGNATLKNFFSVNAQGQHTDGWGTSSESRETFMPGADRTFSLTENRNYEHKSKPEVSFYGQFLPDSVTWITVRGGWLYEKLRNTERQRNAVYDGDPYAFSRHPLDQAFATENLADADGAPTSRSLYRTTTWKEAMNANASLGVRRLLPKKGQLNVGASVSFTDRTSDVLAERDLRFRYDPEANELRYETDHRPEQSLKTSADARYQVWLGKKLLLKMGYEFTHSRDNDRQQHSVTDAAAAPNADEEGETTDPNSYRRRQTSDRHDATLAATLNLGPVSLMPQVQLQHRREHLTYVRGVLDVDRQRYENLWQPQMTMRWKVKRGQSVEADYSLRTDLPDLLETVPYVDDINPLFVSQGNPLLRRTHRHSAGLRYFANITKQQRVFSLSLNYDRRLHPLSAMYFYNEQTGAYRRMMANTGSGTEWNGRVSYEQAAGDYVRLQNILKAGHQRSHGFLTADYDAATAAPNLRKCFFIEDSPTISFEQDKLLLKLGASYRFNRLRYAPQAASNQSLTDYGLEFTARYKWKILTAETNLELEGHKGYSATDMNRARPDWSFTLYCKVLHGKGNVELEFDDILNQQRWYSAMQSATERTESTTQDLHHWVRLSFTYNFDAKGSKKGKK